MRRAGFAFPAGWAQGKTECAMMDAEGLEKRLEKERKG